jgi:hypothetical protein
LGNDLAVLIIEARQKCYRNNNTGEVRDWFYSTLGDLAQSVGFSAKKISRLLYSEHAENFIRFKPTYFYNPELEKRVKGKCLFKVALDDPLTPENELKLVQRDIHKGVSFQEHSNNQNGVKAASLRAQPTGHDVCIKYSTSEKIKESKVIVTNHARSEKGEHKIKTRQKDAQFEGSQKTSFRMSHRDIYLKRRQYYQNPDRYDQLYAFLKTELNQEIVFEKAFLEPCFIGDVKKESDHAIITIDAPSKYHRQQIEARITDKMVQAVSEIVGKKSTIKFAVSQTREITY